jgi:hypothetical protein
MIQAVRRVVHDNIRPQEAYEYFLELRDQNHSERS